ncbi:very long chain fatty acid elongase 7-like isoform X2 [Lycorma delicatula]|uniref:very long chain fatty acid elongase 7-like isoform X2 n=2 Tax=Lycorma delicatula TaxID=130591 RepID=UPI003F513AC0
MSGILIMLLRSYSKLHNTMANYVNMTTVEHVRLFIEDPNHADFDHWSLMESPWKILLTAVMYLAFVLNIGPRFMERRKPFKVKYFLIFYNLVMAVFSAWWVIQFLRYRSIVDGYFHKACHFNHYYKSMDPAELSGIDVLIWLYMASKIMELTDTVIFVMRKKHSQITFLHVYHHVNMLVFTWIFVKYNRNLQIMFIALCNSTVHAVMYIYYMLSALGPSVQKYLWWKKYLTVFQMAQFICIIIFYAWVIANGCDGSRAFSIFSLVNTASFYFLFSKFYKKSYNIKEKLNCN